MTQGRPAPSRNAAGPKRARAADILRPTFKRFFWHTYDHLGTLIAANVLWLVVCLGVVTAPAATAGLFYLARRIAAEEDAHISDFWVGFRRDFVPSLKLGAFTLAVAALFWFNADFYGRLRGGLAVRRHRARDAARLVRRLPAPHARASPPPPRRGRARSRAPSQEVRAPRPRQHRVHRRHHPSGVRPHRHLPRHRHRPPAHPRKPPRDPPGHRPQGAPQEVLPRVPRTQSSPTRPAPCGTSGAPGTARSPSSLPFIKSTSLISMCGLISIDTEALWV